jgi:hypothetical protein
MTADTGEVVPLQGRLSVLGNLKERREKIKEAAVTHLAVPRWTDPVIKVMFKPVDHAIIRRGQNMAEKAGKGNKRSEAEVNANIDVLIAGCVGVYAVIDDSQYSLREDDWEGEYTTFDHDLAANLGCGVTAREVVKALYIFDGDIISTANAIAEFSGYKDQEADEAIAGE